MRVNGERGAQPLECINPPKDRWAVRWDFRDEESGISCEEKVFDHKPAQGEIAIAERIDGAKAELLARILDHDKSGAVNGFSVAGAFGHSDRVWASVRTANSPVSDNFDTQSVSPKRPGVGSVTMWLSREERSALRIRFEAEQRAGVAVTTLWAPGGLSLTITPELGLQMLDALELYAAASFDRTAGYPEKLTFQINP